MKRFLTLLLLPALLLGLSSCTPANQAYYQRAQLYLGSGDFATAASLFGQLGEYEDSAQYALYCAALDALADGRLAVAKANMALLTPFKSSGLYLQYIAALELESEGQLEEALASFDALGSFEDSLTRAEHLREAIPERNLSHARALMGASRWEQALTILESLQGFDESDRLMAQCREQINRAAYDQAVRLYDSEQYEEALAAFESLGETLDAPARARMCRGAMYSRLEDAYANASMDTAQQLIDGYTEMEDYFDSRLRLQDLQARFATNLKLAAAAYAQPYVRFGHHQQLWRVSQVQGSHATLLAQGTLLFATITDLVQPFTPAQEAAIVSYEHPHLVIDLDQYAFTGGTGTPAAPFQ